MPKGSALRPGENAVVKSVSRVFEVFEAFNDARKPMPAIEIGRRLGYPASSTSALLKSMVALGYLSFNRHDRKYFPTIQIATISAYLHGALLGEGNLLALMGDLHSRVGETIILGVIEDLNAKYVHVIPGIYPIMLNLPPGIVRPLCRSGMGWALLSQCANDEIRAIGKRVNATKSEPHVDYKELMALIGTVRKQGYACSYGTYVEGSGIIAMSLPGTSLGRRIAIGAGGPVDRLQAREKEIVRVMRTAIARHFS